MSTSSPPPVNLNESRAGKVATAIILCPALAFIVVMLRLYTRFLLEKKRFLEDYFIVLAMLFSIGSAVGMGLSVLNGFGRHIQTVTREELTMQFKVGIGATTCYALTHLFLKWSIMLQYVRISVLRFEKRLCYTIIGILVIERLTVILVNLNFCRPFKAMWTPGLPGAKCLNRTANSYAALSLIVLMDLVILLLPTFILRHLTLRWYQKVGIAMLLSFGGVACIVSLLRLISLKDSNKSKDTTWNKVNSAFYGAMEPNIGIFCASVVTLRPFFRRYLPFVGSRLDGLGQRHISLNSWNSSRLGRAPNEQPDTTKASDKQGLATEVEHPTDKGTSSVEGQSTLSYKSV